jgi:hypothetical protein
MSGETSSESFTFLFFLKYFLPFFIFFKHAQ